MGPLVRRFRRTRLLVAALALALPGGGLAVLALYYYDDSNFDTIARGVRVAGVDVGGLTVAHAQRRVHVVLWRRLDRPLVLERRARRFRITPRQMGLRAAIAP